MSLTVQPAAAATAPGTGKPSVSARHNRVARKFSARIGEPQTEFSSRWLTRNLHRWRRTIRKLHPFRPDRGDTL